MKKLFQGFLFIFIIALFGWLAVGCSTGDNLAGFSEGAQETMIAQELSATPAPQGAATTPTPTMGNAFNPMPLPSVIAQPQLDGSIAYVSEQNGKTELVLAHVDGSQLITLTQDGVEKNSPVWSPTGQQIAFAANVNGNWDVYVVNVNDGVVTRLTDDLAIDWWPSWSPDGTMIMFESFRDGNFELYRIDRNGGNLFRLTTNPAGDAHPVGSNDGQWIAFVSDHDDSFDIYKMDVNGAMCSV